MKQYFARKFVLAFDLSYDLFVRCVSAKLRIGSPSKNVYRQKTWRMEYD